MEIALNLNSPAFFSITTQFYQEMIIMSTNVFFDYIQTSYNIVLIKKFQWSFLEFLKICQKTLCLWL